MSPPRRRSARLASGVTPKNKAAPELASVAERDDAPETPTRPLARSMMAAIPVPTPRQAPKTPDSGAIKPSYEEMHPQAMHRSTDAPSIGLKLGFTDIKPREPHMVPDIPVSLQRSPSKIGKITNSPFTFRLPRDGTAAPLSENAQRLMDELQQHVQMIKDDLVAQRASEGGEGDSETQERKIAKPKGRTGRFSAAHMAEFKKMDSIENHASAWRANRTPTNRTPVKAALKRSASRANLDDPPTPSRPVLKGSPSKSDLGGPSQLQTQRTLKKTSSQANLGKGGIPTPNVAPGPKDTACNTPRKPQGDPHTTSKRIKQYQHDDASSARPVSRDDSSIPLPKSSAKSMDIVRPSPSLRRLLSPTKSSLAHSGKPTISLVGSPSQPTLGGWKRSATTQSLASPSKAAELRRRIISPGRFDKVKSILLGPKRNGEGARTAIPKPFESVWQTPQPPRTTVEEIPPAPLTTPRRKLVKHVSFTPDVLKAPLLQQSPSPVKFQTSNDKLAVQSNGAAYPDLDGLVDRPEDQVQYPDLTSLRALTEIPVPKADTRSSEPGSFSFRSDHTICFGNPSGKGFGAKSDQASVRVVRGSLAPKTHMPGSFPALPETSRHPDKENKEPPTPNVMPATSHGLSNKKRARVSWEEEEAEEREASERAAKKRKNDHASDVRSAKSIRPTPSTPTPSAKKMQNGRFFSRTPGSATPSKKRGGISMSRLEMLARPKAQASK